MPKPISIVQRYADQYRWRRWSGVYPHLGDLSGALVVDLGCGIGDQARDLSALGATVVGVDAHQDLIDHANRRGIPRARFVRDDITELTPPETAPDGVWASFTVAYFPHAARFLRPVEKMLKPGGWLAITEVDDLFGHEPLASRWVALIERYYRMSLEEGVYRFRSRDHVRETLAARGWRIEADREVEDDELCGTGPAATDLVDAWRARLGVMMPRFRDRFGTDAAGFDAAFLRCLRSERHRSRSRVWFVVARPPDHPRDAG